MLDVNLGNQELKSPAAISEDRVTLIILFSSNFYLGKYTASWLGPILVCGYFSSTYPMHKVCSLNII